MKNKAEYIKKANMTKAKFHKELYELQLTALRIVELAKITSEDGPKDSMPELIALRKRMNQAQNLLTNVNHYATAHRLYTEAVEDSE
jgi:hypothetical protein